MKTHTYIAFLRAVNVGGRFVKMERLRALFEELGLTAVRSHIQSGNVFFETTDKATKAARAALEKRIADHLTKELGYDIPVFLRTIEEVEKAIALDPFKDVKVSADTRLVVLFLSEPLPQHIKLPHITTKGDGTILAATPGEAFLVVQQDGRPGNPAAQIEKAFKIKVTARFWDTTRKILDAAMAEK